MIIRAYNKKAHNAIIQGSITKIFSNNKVQAFVDDSKLFIIIRDNDGPTIYQYLKDDVQLWEQLLQITGAKLELSKCKFFIFTWEFDEHGEAQIKTAENHSNMNINDSDTNLPVIVEAMNHDESYKLLGVPLAFSGDHKPQLESITTKTSHIIKVFQQAPVAPHDLTFGFNTIAIPTIYYPFAAASIPSILLRPIQQKLSNSLLPKLGLNHTFPRAITYAPQYFGGIGFKDMEIEYKIAHIVSILGHLRANTPVLINYTQLIEAYMISAGMNQSPLVDTSEISYVNSPLLELSRAFLRKINGVIELKQIPDIDQLRQFDQNIMKIARSHQFSAKQLKQINQCRFYFQIMFVSKMCSTAGTQIQEYYYDPSHFPDITPTTYSQSKFHWPIQTYPPPASWQTWRKFLALLTKPMMKLELKIGLGHWLEQFDHNRIWKYKYVYPNIITSEPSCKWTPTAQYLRIHEFEANPIPLTSQLDTAYIPVFPIIHDTKLCLQHQRRISFHQITQQIIPKISHTTSPLQSYWQIVHKTSFNEIHPTNTIDIYIVGISNLQKAAGWVDHLCQQHHIISRKM